jgi:flagellar motor switch/type III secretory pathway protein FliN
VSESLLDPEEMEAIQAAIRETAPRRSAQPDHEPTRLALIVDDRTAEAARPILINLATRAARLAISALRPYLPGTWQLDVVGAEIIDGHAAKEELRGGWVAGLQATNPASADGVELVVSAHGPVIDAAAARRCGAPIGAANSQRPPSATALRLFQPTGRAILQTWATAWKEVFSTELAASADLAMVSRLIESRSVVRVALAFGGSVGGRMHVYTRRDVLLPAPTALAAFKANAQRIANALANVPVEVTVELGTLRMQLRELRALAIGSTFTLRNFVDSAIPVYCEGVLKAWARPVVCRGVLAVQIESVVHGQGTKS